MLLFFVYFFLPLLRVYISEPQLNTTDLYRIYKPEELWQLMQPELARQGSELSYSQFVEVFQEYNKSFNATAFTNVMWEPQVTVYEPVAGTNCDPFASGPQTVGPPPRPPPPPGLQFFSGVSPAKVMEQQVMQDPSQATGQLLSGNVASQMAVTMVQTVAAMVSAVVPQFIPPPIWNMMPLPCTPMVTGKNCFGSVFYPITFSDAMLADKTDAVLDAVIEDFPSLFFQRTKGYPVAYENYIKCFQSFMSLQCAALFPTCTNMQATQEFIPGRGRMPTCFFMCIEVLLTCPGFQFADVTDLCESISPLPPPFCAWARYTREDAVPPPIGDDSGEGKACPPIDPELDVSMDPTLYQAYEPQRPLSDFNASAPVQKTLAV